MCPSEAVDLEDPAAARAGAILTIDLDAVADNYRRLCAELGAAACAAVVKADAYGLGMARVAPALARAGARTFFVAQLEEATALRAMFPVEVEIYVLNGLGAGPVAEFQAGRVHPVLNSLGEIDAWAAAARAAGRALPAAVHIDTGISRLGLPDDELEALAADRGRLAGIDLRYLLSHLACADRPEHPLNAEQLRRFRAARARLPDAPASLANSSGIFLGADYHLDLARPGVALYGVNPTPGQPNPMRQVVRLQGKILQVREIDASRTVGYGATHRAAGPTRIATVAVGYADGYLRSLSNRGSAWLGDRRVPVVGRVSMDLITLDVTGASAEAARPGAFVDLIGADLSTDEVAEAAGTIGYEILTSLGRRYHRVYRGGR
ncbi:MAG: alanine racemase [Proteobacteria bacterium]|nr:alanine racemase [Pseudomonadota bacterium]MCH9012264.1 alanine racemase [Pseudomonadota bacterium]